MRRIVLAALSLFIVVVASFGQGRAKYVFYFIGDGMGVNQVNGTETYLAALEGRIGITPLTFTQFPVAGLVTTYSATNGVTDSAAGGTALATGSKTKNGALGVLADLTTPVTSVAVWAQEAGAAVGVSTSVGIDHATPGAFYAHQPKRSMYYEVGQDLIASGFDYFGGSEFHNPTSETAPGGASLYEQCEAAGYVIARGFDDFIAKAGKGKKMILLPPRDNPDDHNSLPYAIDREEGDLTLAQITIAGIAALQSQGKNGFFLMVEGGKIDYACHSNDAAAAFRETIDFDEAIAVAYEFYLLHPDETLIVVTADHETGGIVLGRGPYELHTDVLANQKKSIEYYSHHLEQLYKELGEAFTWEKVQADISAYWGFWDTLDISEEQETRIKEAYQRLTSGTDNSREGLYATLNELAFTVLDVMNELALVGWQSGGHSNGYVPVFAIGPGSEPLNGKIDNTLIAPTIARAAGWK